VYPLGSTVVVKSIVDGSQTFLTGHSDAVTTVALSKCGRFIASGQKSGMGQKVRGESRRGGETFRLHDALFLTFQRPLAGARHPVGLPRGGFARWI
jgi:hypothetical protein